MSFLKSNKGRSLRYRVQKLKRRYMRKLTPQALSLVRFLPPYTLRGPGMSNGCRGKVRVQCSPLRQARRRQKQKQRICRVVTEMVRALQHDYISIHSLLHTFFVHFPCTVCRGLEGRMKSVTFTYNRHFQAYQKDIFALVCVL